MKVNELVESSQSSLWGESFKEPESYVHGHIRTLGASNHSDTTRQTEDFYATDPQALKDLLEYEKFNTTVWEPACGTGWLSDTLEEYGYNVVNSDIIDRGYAKNFTVQDFMLTEGPNKYDIITNPPYKICTEFIRHALDISEPGVKIAMILRLTFLEGIERKSLIFETDPPVRVYPFSRRVLMAKDGVFPKGSAVAYAWFVWEKGFKGRPEIIWL